ncbi:DUF1707 SHOCT-like domain-containing protein [Rhodococcoides yunnanense]|uniref:DUF1707 SHOCT-like domain-containing protein n=1 Tax=Rhodococcoides yunnanense TaxID=278209 RepID=UPI000AC306C1|nr:DUF1707 domain-containing protein [Rhodococcus yunnanensis]
MKGKNTVVTRPDMRARDIDRARTASALDEAYADGQLSFDEHRLRNDRARGAVTLAELRALVTDLQLNVDLPDPEPRSARPKPRVVLALGSVVIIAAGLAVFFAMNSHSEDLPTPAPTPSASVPTAAAPLLDDVVPIVARPFDFGTAEGLDDFRNRYIERFGDADVIEIDLQPADQRASIYRLDDDGRVQRVMVSGGFEPQSDTDVLDEDKRVFDWTLLDSTVVAGVVAGAPQSIGASDGVSKYVTIDDDAGEQRISISVYVDDSNGGYVETDFAGNPITVNAYTP